MDLVLTKSRNASMYGSCLFFKKKFFCLVKTVKLHMFNEYGNEVKFGSTLIKLLFSFSNVY